MTDWNDEVSVLGSGDEIARGNQPQLRMVPANERLEADHARVRQLDDWLILEEELAALDCRPEVDLDSQRGHCPLVHVFVEDDVAAAARVLGSI